jgi:hypothetical protein
MDRLRKCFKPMAWPEALLFGLAVFIGLYVVSYLF